MDFKPDEATAVLGELSARILGDFSATTRLETAESDARGGGSGLDGEAWSALIEAGVVAAFADATPVASDDSTGVVAAAFACRAHGAAMAAVPVWSTLAAILAIRRCADRRFAELLDEFGTGEAGATVALVDADLHHPDVPTALLGDDGRLTGQKFAVPDGSRARWTVLSAADPSGRPVVCLLDLEADGVTREPLTTTDRRAAAHVSIARAPVLEIGGPDAHRWVIDMSKTLVCATQAGVCEHAVRDTASFLDTRRQFGRPLSSFQAPVHRLVDGHIEVEAIWLTALLAAWRLDRGIDAASAVDVAKWWCADAGSRVVHATQHLHGGIGADVSYPIHRTFLWAKQLAETLGGAGSHLQHLGDVLAVAEVDHG